MTPSPDMFPLSFCEELLWITDYTPATAPFFDCALSLQFGARLRGVDVRALVRSVSDLLHRHDILRSTVHERDGTPYRMVRDVTGEEFRLIDVTTLSRTEGRAAVAALVEQEMAREIDLAEGPLFRPVLVRLAEDEHVFVCVVHHLVFDAWSQVVFVRELKQLYEAHSTGQPHRLAPPLVRHDDYVGWQHARFNDECVDLVAPDMAAWFADVRVTAVASPRPDETAAANMRLFRIDSAVCVLLEQVRAEYVVTVAVLLLAIYICVLRRATGVGDLLIGVPVADRRRPEFESLIGLFVDVVVVRADGDPHQTFEQTVGRLRARLREAYHAHRVLPYARFARWKRDHRIDVPDYPFVFSFHPEKPEARIELPGATVEEHLGLIPGRQRCLADASLQIAETGPELLCLLRLSPGLAAIDDFVEQFVQTVMSIAHRGTVADSRRTERV